MFLNGAILGMSKRDLERRFDDIVAFAELDQFIDTQVRFYSSGMYVRLGFAIAVNVEPDILLVDEVLAVGDEAFQRKCLDRVEQFQHEGRTIVVVSHAPTSCAGSASRPRCSTTATWSRRATRRKPVQVFREHLRMTPPRPKPGEPPAVDDRVRVTDGAVRPPRSSPSGLPRRRVSRCRSTSRSRSTRRSTTPCSH